MPHPTTPSSIRPHGHAATVSHGSKRLSLAVATALAAGLALYAPAQALADPPPNVAEVPVSLAEAANAIVDLLDAGDFAAVHARFDPTMAAALSAEQLQAAWTALPTQVGAAQGRGEARMAHQNGIDVVSLPLRYENATLEAMIAFDANRRIAGFRVIPVEAAAPPAPAVATDANYRESELRIGDAATALPATLTMPIGDGPFPAVVLVHGSGPQDRDSTIGPNRPFLDIARGLAARGVAVLRYEKRSKVRPQDYAAGVTIDNETTDDAVLAVAALRAQPRVDPGRIFVLGHSQGGMMAPRIGKRDPKIAGLILLAAPARPLLDILIEQNRRIAVLNDGKTSDAENAAIEKLAAAVGAVRDGREITAAEAPLGQSPEYWRSVDAVDPVSEAREIAQPLLFLQGARDIQVVDADWQRWKSAFHADPRASFKLYPALNHLAIPGEGDGDLQDYARPGHVDPQLIADVADWINARSAPQSTE